MPRMTSVDVRLNMKQSKAYAVALLRFLAAEFDLHDEKVRPKDLAALFRDHADEIEKQAAQVDKLERERRDREARA